MEPKKQFKYYAIRIAGMVIFRRTVNKLTKVRSLLYKPRSEFRLEQVTYTGGKVVGCMLYRDWIGHGGVGISTCKQITKEQFRAMGPYISSSE